jgi:hypothetical protein
MVADFGRRSQRDSRVVHGGGEVKLVKPSNGEAWQFVVGNANGAVTITIKRDGKRQSSFKFTPADADSVAEQFRIHAAHARGKAIEAKAAADKAREVMGKAVATKGRKGAKGLLKVVK